VRGALVAHLCRCTGWQTVVEAALQAMGNEPRPVPCPVRDGLLIAWRAQVEGPKFQSLGPDVALGAGGFADDTAPRPALVVLLDDHGEEVLGRSLVETRRLAHRTPGRNSGAQVTHPLELPPGKWDLTLRTTWVEPAYLEPDASWCQPGGLPASPLANGGAFGGKRRSPVSALAKELADVHGETVRMLWTREDVVRYGPKRPPVAIGIRADGSGVMRVARTPASGDLSVLASVVGARAPLLSVEEVRVQGPPTGADLRAVGWAEAEIVLAALRALSAGDAGPGTPVRVTASSGGRAVVTLGEDGEVSVEVWAGEVLDEVTLRSYCIGAVHQALGWVRNEAIAVDADGRAQDLTIRSFGILAARDTPRISVTLHPGDGLPVNGSDAVFVATAAAAWLADGLAPDWPTRRGS